MMGKFYIYSGGGRNPSGMVLPHFDTTLLHLCNKPETGLNTIMSFQKRCVKNGYGPCIPRDADILRTGRIRPLEWGLPPC